MVLEPSGNADSPTRTYAAYSLAKALRAVGIGAGLLPVTVEQGIAHAPELCKANAGSALYAPTLTIVPGARGGVSIQLDVVAYDCNAAPLANQHLTSSLGAGRLETAIDGATAKIAGGLLEGGR